MTMTMAKEEVFALAISGFDSSIIDVHLHEGEEHEHEDDHAEEDEHHEEGACRAIHV